MKWKQIAIGSVGGLVLAGILPYAFGEFDYFMVLHGKDPVFSRIHAAASDGGTLWYMGFGYELYSYHSFTEGDPIRCIVGPSIHYVVPYQAIEDHENKIEQPC